MTTTGSPSTRNSHFQPDRPQVPSIFRRRPDTGPATTDDIGTATMNHANPGDDSGSSHRQVRDEAEDREDTGAVVGWRDREDGVQAAMEGGSKARTGDRGREEDGL